MKIDPSQIRMLEAVSFRSFPATTTQYDGTWAIRLTAGHPAKRLNSVNPLDPHDRLDLDNRIELASRRFTTFGRPLIFRLTPLAPIELRENLVNRGWDTFEESIVMRLELQSIDLDGARDQLPLQDLGRWVDDFIELSGDRKELKPGLAEIINATEPTTGLFLQTDKEETRTASMVRCVCDRSMAGVFDVVSSPTLRNKGHARNVMLSALLWARRNRARYAWLQVLADNQPANELYRSMGFKEIYRYRYWSPRQSDVLGQR